MEINKQITVKKKKINKQKIIFIYSFIYWNEIELTACYVIL